MAAGIAQLTALHEGGAAFYDRLAAVTQKIAEGVEAEARRAGVALVTNRIGSMFTWFFQPQENLVRDFADAARSDSALFGRFHRAMLERGVWLPPSQYEAAFVSAAHGEAEIAATVDAARESFRELAV